MNIRNILSVMIITFAFYWPATSSAQSGAWTAPARMTHMGPDLNFNYDAREAEIAFNSRDNEYLLVWEGTDKRSGISADEAEIYAQRVNADTGALVGKTAFRVSFMGPSGMAVYDARNPVVTYNPTHNEYLVVWYGDDDRGALVEGEFEIFGQRINASTGALVGSRNFRISDMGPDGVRNYDAIDPVVSYNATDDLYLVAWRGEDGTNTSPNGQFEIYGQLLDGASGAEVGVNDFPISSMGPLDDPNYDAFSPALAYNMVSDEFMVVWYGDDNRAPLVDNEFEVFAQRVAADTGVLMGVSPIRVSDAGNNGDLLREARRPDVSWNRDRNEYLVVWSADDTNGGRLDEEFEIYGQMLTALGVETGQNDFLISNMGGAAESIFDAFQPSVAYHGAAHQFVVSWRGDNTVDGEYEIFSQRLDAPTRTPIGTPDQRLSHAGPDNSALYDARKVAMVEDAANGRIFVTWEQENESPTQTAGEFELYSSAMGASTFKVVDGISGSWFDRSHDGEGWVIEIINADKAIVYWFTYADDTPDQAWVLGVGDIIDNRIVINDVEITSGGIFGPNFDPNTVQRNKWGSFVLEFEDCKTAGMNHSSTVGTYGEGSLSPVRLTSLAGLGCPGPGVNTDPNSAFSGSWFDPSHDGEGWVLGYLGDNRIVFYWFTYDNAGNQAWFLGVGTVSGNVATFNDARISSGTRFGANFDPAAVQLPRWGDVSFTLLNCKEITVDYASVDPAYGAGQLNARRLVTPAGLSCN